MKSRLELIQTLPKGGVVAEVGVWEGEFSAQILEVAAPARLVLIDMWKHFNDPTDIRVTRATQARMDAMYASVAARFAHRPEVELIRASSLNASKLFAAATFDWVYLDACHGYKEVREDLVAWWPLVKVGGYLAGHDYNHRCGVRQAVDEFKHGQLVHVTHEGTPSFALRKV